MCDKQKSVEYGTHSIYIANIDEVWVTEATQKVLVYADAAYHYV